MAVYSPETPQRGQGSGVSRSLLPFESRICTRRRCASILPIFKFRPSLNRKPMLYAVTENMDTHKKRLLRHRISIRRQVAKQPDPYSIRINDND